LGIAQLKKPLKRKTPGEKIRYEKSELPKTRE